MTTNKDGSSDKVHATHCCARHGCKYGDDDCPVESGRIKQEYPCDDCAHEELKLNAAIRKAVELGVMQDTPAMREAMQAILVAASKDE